MLSYHKECLLYGSVIEDCRLGELRLMVYGFGRVGLILASIRALLCRRRLSTFVLKHHTSRGHHPQLQATTQSSSAGLQGAPRNKQLSADLVLADDLMAQAVAY